MKGAVEAVRVGDLGQLLSIISIRPLFGRDSVFDLRGERYGRVYYVTPAGEAVACRDAAIDAWGAEGGTW